MKSVFLVGYNPVAPWIEQCRLGPEEWRRRSGRAARTKKGAVATGKWSREMQQ